METPKLFFGSYKSDRKDLDLITENQVLEDLEYLKTKGYYIEQVWYNCYRINGLLDINPETREYYNRFNYMKGKIKNDVRGFVHIAFKNIKTKRL